MFGIGETELILILAFAFMVFGPDKLPGMGRTLGRALRQFRHAQEGFTQVVQSEVIDPATEAMGVDGKKPNRKRSEEFEEDADLEVADGEQAPAPKRTETFAERKKRLAEEKAARDAAAREAAATAAASDEPVDAAGEKDAPADEDVASATEAPAAPAEPEPAPEPKKPTAADLYSMTAKSRSSKESTGTPASAESGHAGGDSLSASRAASEEQSDERRAGEAVPSGVAATPADEKEA